MITPKSRYADATITTVDDPYRGTHLSVNRPAPKAHHFQFTFYQFEEDVTVDYLAGFSYGDSSLWWRIADANPEIMDWTLVPVGTVIRIPNV